jgi:hypothetical protein
MNLEHCRNDAKRLLRAVAAGDAEAWARAGKVLGDRGTALQRAGAAAGWRRARPRVHAELDVNITRAGVVWLPVVPVGPREPEVVKRVGRASLVFFQELLELDGR